VTAGFYGRQQINGDKAAPGCVFTGARGATLGDLSTRGDFFTLRNVTIDVGSAKRAGWEASARHVTLRNVRLRGPFVSVDIHDASDVKWIGGELGARGRKGGRRVCGEDAEPVQVENADHVVFEGIDFHPQGADPSPSSCSANGFHLEMIRLDYGTSYFTLRDSTLDNGDASDTASVFITEPGGDRDPQQLRFENNFFGTNDSVNGAFDVHANVTTCRGFTFAYNTFRAPTGAFQCGSAVDTRWIGNLGANGPSSPCVGSYVRNVWQDPRRDHCGSDKWVVGTRGRVDRLGLGGPGSFYLMPRSPGINAGELSYCTTLLGRRDHDGGRRPVGRRCDAGADERR
jgi:hypothetical protein